MDIMGKIVEISYTIGKVPDAEDKEFYFDTLEKTLNDIGSYVKSVYEMETLSVIYRDRYEPKERAEKINELDHKRRDAHNNMLYSFEKMNNICKNIDCVPIYESEIVKEGDGYTFDTRDKAAEFAGEALATYYVNARNAHRFKDVVEEVTPELQKIKEDIYGR